MPECRCATRYVSGQQGWGREGVWNWGNSKKILSKATQKEGMQGNILKFFLPDALKTTF